MDPRTGKTVRMMVQPGSAPKTAVKSGSRAASKPSPVSTSYLDHRIVSGTPEVMMQLGVRTPQQSSRPAKDDRLPGFIVPTEERQGKESKLPDIVQHARNCPVAWTTKVTSDKLNMGLWCWAYMSDLLATRTGMSPTLPRGVLEARMQHFLNTLEVALQPSNPTEFDSHSWRVARLYAEKVQHRIDRGSSWIHFADRYGEDSHPHELMAAREELAKPVRKVREEPPNIKNKVKDDPLKNRRTCTTWNTSLDEGKCDWEAQNDGRNCDRRHECSWCKEKGKKSLHHQRSFCRQRIAAGDQ